MRSLAWRVILSGPPAITEIYLSIAFPMMMTKSTPTAETKNISQSKRSQARPPLGPPKIIAIKMPPNVISANARMGPMRGC